MSANNVNGIIGAEVTTTGIIGATVAIGQYIVNDYVITISPVEGDYGYTMTITRGSDTQTVTLYGLSTEQYNSMLGYLQQAQEAAQSAEGSASDAFEYLARALDAANRATNLALRAEQASDTAQSYATQADTAKQSAETAKTDAQTARTQAQGYWQAAEAAATRAGSAATRAETAAEEITGMTAEAETLEPGSPATASFLDGVLSLGIPAGANGAAGNGIVSIVKTGTSGNVDTYTITYTNGTTSTFTVRNGVDGAVTSVAGKTGAVTLDAGDVAFDDQQIYNDGTVGAGLAGIKSQMKGSQTYTKAALLSEYGKYSENLLYSAKNLTIGTSTLSNVITTASTGAYSIKIPVVSGSDVSFPVFKTTNQFASAFFIGDGDVILGLYYEATADTGTSHTMTAPNGAAYMLLCISSSLSALDWSVTINTGMGLDGIAALCQDNADDIVALDDRVAEIEAGGVKRVNKADVTTFYDTGYLYSLSNVVVGTTMESAIPKSQSTGAVSVKIPLSGIKTLIYPMFKTSMGAGSYMCDNNGIVVWKYANATENNGSMRTIAIPENASYFILSISNSLNALGWYYETSGHYPTPPKPSPFVDVDRNLCLAAIKTDILTEKIPYHRGFLFHKMAQNDNSLWYGTNLDNAQLFAVVGFDPTVMRMAISPKDGRIIAVQRDARNGIWIYDGTTTTHLDSFTTNPMAWLYNSGVDFIVDGNGVEHCIFAEYFGNPTSGTVYNVWRGTYPYTSVSDWEIVKSVAYNMIMHFHMVRRDPWTDILYLTSGDGNAQCNWWYSEDYGENWTLLVNGAESGWPDQVCRTINFVFTADWIYWATDHGTNHMLCKASRDNNGLIDITSRAKLADLPDGYATNSICYSESPKGIFMYDRVDAGYSPQYGDPVTMKFWDIEHEELVDIVTLGLTASTWGGSRGKCYVNYTNTVQPYPAMGFSIDTPCIFDLICDVPAKIGTIVYDVGAKTVKTVNYN